MDPYNKKHKCKCCEHRNETTDSSTKVLFYPPNLNLKYNFYNLFIVPSIESSYQIKIFLFISKEPLKFSKVLLVSLLNLPRLLPTLRNLPRNENKIIYNEGNVYQL